MTDTISVKEAARRRNLTERSVTGFCREGKIPGAKKIGRNWIIPASAEKPADNRIRTGAYRKPVRRPDCLPLPVGVSDYRLASTEYYYVDKTLMIRDFLDERPMVLLFTRPRRFGKTLNMDMLRTFFEKTNEDTSRYFKDKKIWACGDRYRGYQGKYPVIFLTFKDVKYNSWEETLEDIKNIFAQEYKRHSELRASGRTDKAEKEYFHKITAKTATMIDLSHALEYLSQMLHEHYGECAVVIVDEYDTPIQQGHMKGFYEDVISFMRNLLSGCFKDNKHLAYGFLTGILRAAKESIFSGLNNLVINSALDHKYSEYFGFTAEEVREMAAYYGSIDKFDEVCEWYDGYRFGRTEIFNPWSVINYFSNDCEPRTFWLSTGSNDIIGEVISEADDEICQRLTSLVSGGSFTTYIDTGVIYPQVGSNPSSIYSFLLVAGYLKVIRSSVSIGGDFMCEVALPNKEISLVYRKEILQKFEGMIPQSTAIAVQEAIFSGGGRYDIQLCPKTADLPGIIIELKAGKNCTESELKSLSAAALKQIDDQKYDTEMKAKGVRTIYKYGVAFSGKRVEVAVE